MSQEAPLSADATLAGLRIDRSSTAERVADRLRDLITRGDIKPGSPLREGEMVDALRVSRNTVREAFRLLAREGLVIHEMHRGVVVKQLMRLDVRDIYLTRSVIERSAIACAESSDDTVLQRMVDGVEQAHRAAEAQDWKKVATLDLLFHQRIVGLLGSARVDAFFRGILAELRLAFALIEDQQQLLAPYVPWNRQLARLIAEREIERCQTELRRYLEEAERTILASLAPEP